MKPHGTYKLTRRGRRRGFPGLVCAESVRPEPDSLLDRIALDELREQRILDSLRQEICEGGVGLDLRIRRVFVTPREIFRLEIELPDLGYQRTTFLDRDALESLLETDAVREVVEATVAGAAAP
jgi:hypothetical protein